MSLYDSLRTAANGLTTNKLRAALTMLGIIIGVASVVTLLSVGEGVETTIANQIQGIGSNLLFVFPEQSDDSTGPAYLTAEDAEALADPFNAPALAAVSPAVQGTLRATRDDHAISAVVSGTNHQYNNVRSLELVAGDFLTEADSDDQARVAVLGWQVYRELFDDNDFPIGQLISIEGIRFEVIGVVKEIGGFGDDDSTIYIPLTVAQTRFFTQRTLSGERPVFAIFASALDESQVEAASEQITAVLRERHGLAGSDQDDFRVTSQQSILEIAGQVTGILTLFLGAIAGISLLVGGIGIMNIMLVSVTERTREVGIRKAIGATRRDILLQFLLEAMFLSFVGGLLGLALGVGGASLISNLSPDLSTKLTPGVMTLAVGVASAVGLVFGVYPAVRAGNLRPIEALRYE